MPDVLRVHDEFTDTTGTLLQAHVPTVLGSSWTLEFQETFPTSLAITSSGSVFPTATRASERFIYSAQPNPTGREQRIEARLRDRGPADEPWILFGRASSGNWTTGYAVACYASSTRLYKKVSGVVTQLGSNGPAIAVNSIVQLALLGVSLTVLDDGVAIISALDGEITQAGRWGVAAGDLFVATDDIDGQEFDTFKAWDAEPATDVLLDSAPGSLRIVSSAPVYDEIETPPWRIFKV